jgi:hypothetical protein
LTRENAIILRNILKEVPQDGRQIAEQFQRTKESPETQPEGKEGFEERETGLKALLISSRK